MVDKSKKFCPLCEKEVDCLHKKSHLIPEWMYKDAYDDNHKLISVDLNNEYARKRQKGFYDQIICTACEIQSQKYDQYASLVLTDRSTDSKEYLAVSRKDEVAYKGGKKLKFSIWENIDFPKLQKFVFACLLRTHFSMLNSGNYLLIDKHYKKIRNLYLDQRSNDDSTYPILLNKYIKDDIGFESILIPPFKNKKDGYFIIEFSGASFLFWVYVSSHKKPCDAHNLRLKADGSCYILKHEFRQTGTFKVSSNHLHDIAKNYPCD